MNNTDYTSTNIKLTIGQRMNYAISEFGYNAIYYWVTAYMLIFYTDIIGVAAGAVSVLTLVVRIFDAVNDPMIGSLADRTKSKWGRYRPWVFIGGTIMSLLILLLFNAQPDWPYTTKVVYMWVIYILVTVASTCCNMPFGALNGVLTSDGFERQKLSSMRMVFANIGSNFTGLVAVPLIVFFSDAGGQQTQRGYLLAVALCIILGLPTMLWTSCKVREVVQPPPTQKSIPLKKQMGTLIHNKYIILAIFAQVVSGFNAYGRMGILMYYFTYYANNDALMSIQGVIGIAGGIIGSGFVGTLIYKKLQNKGRTIQVCYFGAAIGYVALFLMNPNATPFWIVAFLTQCIQSGAGSTGYALIPDAIDYGEYRTGVRCDGFLAALVSFGLKAGGAVGPAIMLAILGAMGYVANQVQNATVLTFLNMCISVIPAVCCIVIVLLYCLWDMTAERHEEIRVELEKRRK